MLEMFVGPILWACATGVVGNRTDDAMVAAWQRFIQRFGNPEENNDIQKALNRSFQLSLEQICDECLEKSGDHEWFTGKKSSIKEELKEIKKKKFDKPTAEEFDEVKTLLDQVQNNDAIVEEKLQKIVNKIIERAIGNNGAPECYRKGVEDKIFDLMSQNFLKEFKNNPVMRDDINVLLQLQTHDKLDQTQNGINKIDKKVDKLNKKIDQLPNEPIIATHCLDLLTPTKERFKFFCKEYGRKDKKVLVVGDVMLDHKIKGIESDYRDVQKHELLKRKKKDAEVYAISHESKTLGGAGDIAAAFSEISDVTLIGVIGTDYEGQTLIKECKGQVHFDLLITPEVKTTTKVYTYRLSEEPNKDVIRFDRENIELMTKYCSREDVKDTIIDKVRKYVNDVDCIVIKDHQKGMITKEIVKRIEAIASASNKPLYVDPKYDWEKFDDVVIEAILPNIKEAASGLYDIVKDEHKVMERDNHCRLKDDEYALLAKKYPNCRNFIIKAASNGAVIIPQNEDKIEVRRFIVEDNIFKTDVGCGDVFDAFAIIGRLHRRSLEESVLFANFVAGLKAKKSLGEPVSLKNIKEEIERNSFEIYVRDNKSLIHQIRPMNITQVYRAGTTK